MGWRIQSLRRRISICGCILLGETVGPNSRKIGCQLSFDLGSKSHMNLGEYIEKRGLGMGVFSLKLSDFFFFDSLF